MTRGAADAVERTRAHVTSEVPPAGRARFDRHLRRPAAARHRRLPAHDRAALRRPREVDPRPRGGRQGRPSHPPRDPDQRHRRRSRPERDLRGRHARERAAAAQASGRNRQGAGRGREPRPPQGLQPHRRLLRGRGGGLSGRTRRPDRGRGARPLGDLRVRELREAQQEDLARGRLRRDADRGALEARRHGRLAPRGQDRRQAGDPRDCRPSASASRRCSG